MIAKPNLKGISDGLMKSGNKDFRIEEMKGLNHLFQNAATGLISEYSNIEETIAPKALNLMSNWIISKIK